MRIIAGRYGSRRLEVPGGKLVRPTGDRMKESIFSALGSRCREARVLDLFAGSGALGLEALSRGASALTLVEQSGSSIRTLKKNIAALGVESCCTVIQADVFSFLRNLREQDSFDLVFADPPFDSSGAQEVLSNWIAGRPATEVLVLEFRSNLLLQVPEGTVEVVKNAAFGESSYNVFCLTSLEHTGEPS